MRYLPHTQADRQAMLGAIGVDTIDALYRDVPADVRVGGFDGLSDHMGELEVERHLAAMAGRNLPAGAAACFLGAGAYRHYVPASVDHLIQRSEFLTAYTPYQPEISQGTLQMLFEFQSQVALITGMEVANASTYDGASACAEAAMMALRLTRRGRVVLSGGLHPHYRDTTQTMARFTHFDVAALPANVAGDEDLVAALDDDTACVVVQNPDVFGRVRDLSALAAAVHERGALLVVAFTEALSLGALRSPGAMGADIVVGEGQSIGNGLNFGGPYLGLFAARQKFVRQMPGRLCGQTTDADGRRGFVLTLSTREQHIRRDKATSNICTNSGLCALAFCIHLSLLGEQGFTRLAQLNHAKAVQLAESLEAVDGVELLNQHFFNEVTVRLPRPAASVADALAARNVLGGVPASRLFAGADGLDDLLILAATETNTDEDIAALTTALQEVL